MEAWTFPLKLVRDFHLVFHVDGQAVPAEDFARTLTVHPESSAILYSGDSFQVRETIFIPVDQPGAILQFEIESEQPIEIEAVFQGDLQLEWPAAIGGTYSCVVARSSRICSGRRAEQVCGDHRLSDRSCGPV